MSGHSLHTKDWLTLAGGAALAATGLGAAGIGPLAGLMGAGTAAAAPVAGDAFMPAALVGDVSSTAPAESAGLLAGIKSGVRGAYQSALDSPVAQNIGLSQVYPGPPSPDGSLPVGLSQNVMKTGDVLGKISKAQSAYQKASGLLGGQSQGGGAAPAPRQFGAGASPTNLSQYMNQPNPMMPSMSPQGQMTPEMLALLLKMQQGQGGLYG